jgi:hypothetical protein
MAASPTSRTTQHCRELGFQIGIVEHWNSHVKIRQDLFGCIDMICCIPGVGLLGIQATSTSNVSSRMKKAKAEPRLRQWLESGAGFEVWGWGKNKKTGRITLRREIITIDELTDLEEEHDDTL